MRRDIHYDGDTCPASGEYEGWVTHCRRQGERSVT